MFKKVFTTLIIIIILICLTCFYAFKIEPKMLVAKKINIISTDIDMQILTIVQLSDLELSENYNIEQLPKIVDKVKSLNPDILFFTGDLFNNYAKYHPVEEVIASLTEMSAVYGKYAIWGNNDYGGGASRNYADIMEQAGFVLLKNESTAISLANGKEIYIGAVDDALLGSPDIEKAMRKNNDSYVYKILLAHNPSIVDYIKEYDIDLVLAGHTHGGQAKIPFRNKIITDIDEKYINGLYEIETLTKTKMYVNSGMGTSRIPVRFLTPPQIAVFYIKSK